MDLALLICGAIVCGIIYIAIFGYAINEILKIYAKKSFSKKRYLWRFILAGILSFSAYCGVFTISQFVENSKIADFVKNSNNTIFGFLIAALIAQFLSSLFSRQQYEYQKQRDLNLAEADKLEAILALLNKLYISRTMPINDIISFLLQYPDVKKLSPERQNQYTELIQLFNKSRVDYVTNTQILQDNMTVLSLTTMFEYIKQHLLNDALDKLPSCMPDELYLTKLNDIIIQKTEITRYKGEFNSLLNSTSPYLTVIRAVLFNIAKSHRGNLKIAYPSEIELSSFTYSQQELANWVANIERQLKSNT